MCPGKEERLKIEILSDKNDYRPREKVTVHLKTKDSQGMGIPACLSLAVADVGVLSLIGYQTPDPFSFFYAHKPLSVDTSETRIHIVSQMLFGDKGEEAGGSGEEKMAASVPGLAQVLLRGDFKSTAYWNPSLITDENGEATVSFELPDNLTTFRIMACGQSRDSRFGQAEKTFKVSKSLLLLPSMPRFARLGDKFSAGVVVHNFSRNKGTVTLNLEAKGIRILDKETLRQFPLQPGESKEVLFSFEVEESGRAFFLFRARMNEETDGLEIALPLQQARPREASAVFAERQEISLFGKSLLLKALFWGKGPQTTQNILIQELLNKIKVSPAHACFEEDEREGPWTYSSSIRSTAIILQSFLEVGFDHPQLTSIARWLVEQSKAGRWRSTQENLFGFYSLNDFYRFHEKTRPDFQVEMILEKKQILKEHFPEGDKKIVSAKTSLAQMKEGQTYTLKISKTGHGILYYGARMFYSPKEKLPPRDEGLAVWKTIEQLEGKAGQSIRAGSLQVVTLRIAVARESQFVVVDDPLPAGFEAVNPAFLTEIEEKQKKLEQYKGQEEQSWWEGFSHVERHDDRLLLFGDALSPGIHTHRYLVRALTPGEFDAPGTRAEEMYYPEVFGRSPEIRVSIIR